jgi:hypothetical protein
MTWQDFMGARQLMMEERVGTRQRLAVKSEDAQMAQSLERLKGME